MLMAIKAGRGVLFNKNPGRRAGLAGWEIHVREG